jgi:hypothetical protein
MRWLEQKYKRETPVQIDVESLIQETGLTADEASSALMFLRDVAHRLAHARDPELKGYYVIRRVF